MARKGTLQYVILICHTFLATTALGELLKARNHQIQGFTKAEQGRWEEPHIFVQGSDPQPGLIDRINGGNGTEWDEDIKRLNEAIAAVNRMTTRPPFFFISGDMVDAFPGEEPYKTEQTRDVLSCLSNVSVPTMIIGGNHDMLNTPTKSSIQEFREQYGDDYYSFYYGGVMYIALNSQYFFNASEVKDLAQEHMEWLDDQLRVAKSDDNLKYVVIFMHIPLFLQSGDEADEYFNIPKPLRVTLMENFMNAGAKIVFSGHYHRNAGGVWTEVIEGRELTIESVVSSAIGAQLGNDKSGLRLVKVGEDRITHKYYPFEDFPKSGSVANKCKNELIYILIMCVFAFKVKMFYPSV